MYREIFQRHLEKYYSFNNVELATEYSCILARPISKQRLISLANFKLILTTKTHLCSGIRSKICAPFFLQLYGYRLRQWTQRPHILHMCCLEYVSSYGCARNVQVHSLRHIRWRCIYNVLIDTYELNVSFTNIACGGCFQFPQLRA